VLIGLVVLVAFGVLVSSVFTSASRVGGDRSHDVKRVAASAAAFRVVGATGLSRVRTSPASCLDSVGPPATATRSAEVAGTRSLLIQTLRAEAARVGWVPRSPDAGEIGLTYQHANEPYGDRLTVSVGREGPHRRVTWIVAGPTPMC
jgi:hypothetical protein